MFETYSFTAAQKLFIKPFERVKFVLIFCLSTTLSQLVSFFILQQLAFDALGELNEIQYSIVAGILTGTFVGAAQWFVLRKYVPDWKWILVVSLGITFLSSISATSRVLNSSSFPNINLQVVLLYLIQAIASLGALLLYGYLQWWILRPYIVKGRWWIFLPLISILIVPFHVIFIYLTGIRSLVNFDFYIFSSILSPAIQAISFCSLQRKSPLNAHPEVSSQVESNLFLAPDIVNYWKIRSLTRKLYQRINQAWKTDLNCNEQLIYLIGVSRNGTIIGYEPMNKVAVDCIDQTPLLNLTHHSDSTNSLSIAKFQVVFTPPATVKIYSWRGIPLLWLAVSVYLVILAISTYPMFCVHSNGCNIIH
jgi:hypothetical protein